MDPAILRAARLKSPGNRGLSAHILPTSATMIGVCMTVMTIGRLGPSQHIHFLLDKLLAFDALLFRSSAVISFMSIRSSSRAERYESAAEVLFVGGLGILTLAAIGLAFEVS